jgi:type I restriction enzyme M protein
MACRPVFKVSKYNNTNKFVDEIMFDFQWFPGFAVSQKQKSIIALHGKVSEQFHDAEILEISSKSQNEIGVKLSAFNLQITHKNTNEKFTVESAFQSSKVFEGGGPFIDIRFMDSRDAKKDNRLKNSGELKYFQFFNSKWGLEPKTAFYDWLYINALNQNRNLSKEIIKYDIFTDIEFNQKKSINCQARSAALYVSLYKMDLLDEVLESIGSYKKIVCSFSNDILIDNSSQIDFFDL